MKTTAILPVISIVLGLSSIGNAKEKEYRLSEWSIGKVLFGERVSKAVTKDKVVVIENWGVNCPPCIASLPHLAQLEKDNRAKGLVIIGAESQGSTKEEIKPLIEKAKVEYTITDSADGPIEVTGIPRAFVFNRQGKMVFDGNPNGKEFTEAVTKALAEGAPVTAEGAATTPSATPGAAAPAALDREQHLDQCRGQGNPRRGEIRGCHSRHLPHGRRQGSEIPAGKTLGGLPQRDLHRGEVIC